MASADLAVVVAVVAARLLVPLAIPAYPLPAVLAALAVDAVDQTVFQSYTRLDLAWYQGYDKALDVYELTVAYLATFRNWANRDAFAMGRFLFYYRLVGVALFELFHLRALLLFFPNTFEYFFIAVEVVRRRWEPRRLGRTAVVLLAFALWVFVKVPQEYWIHIARFDLTDVLKVHVFGVSVATGWGDAIAANPWPAAALAAPAAGMALGLRWLVVHRLPPPARRAPTGWGMPVADVTPAEVQQAQVTLARRVFDGELAEKLLLVSLLTVIFAQILPGLRATTGELLAGVALVVLANTAVSEWLDRSGVVWPSLPARFAAMAALNLAILVAFVGVMPLTRGTFNPGNALFFLFLLTLIVTLDDQFRPYQLARTRRVRAARAHPPLA